MAASVTRILELSGFDSQIKTRDVHAAFADLGAPKIKWIDDHSLYLVFNDAATAKRVFLQCLGSPPHQLTPAPNSSVNLTPYKGPDSQAIIAHTQRSGPRSERANSIASQDAAMSLTTGNVSPAVSMMLMAAATANGPPGTLGGSLNGTHFPLMNQQQQFNGYSFTPSHSNGSLHSSYSQGSVLDPFAFGYSMSGHLNGSLSNSSSWSDSSLASGNRLGGRNGSFSLPPNAFPMSRSGLENIQEASSREEMSHSQTAHAPQGHPAGIVVTESTPIAGAGLEKQQAQAIKTIRTPSPQLKPRSATEKSTSPWLSREPSPTPSMPAAHKDTPGDELVDAVNKLEIQERASGEDGIAEPGKLSETAFNRGINTPPEGGAIIPSKVSTPPRVGNPARRMLGHALGIRHPSLPPRVIAGANTN